ncbi:uncharacterized protein LOC143279651 isoform X1 [Babylonia areolata]|uniref:uncharacterized protein LOC143279651 isoform X1 n=1 Tax=Babylonia areolata TaxID=304850 RepID=UPI003FCFC151
MGSGASKRSESISADTASQDSMSRPASNADPRRKSASGNGPPQYSKRQAPPPPRPPAKKKEEVFKETNYQHVDEHVMKTPQKLYNGTFRELVTYLTSNPDWDELARVRAIFRWVTSVDVFSLNIDDTPPKQSPMEYFVKIRNNTGNHAHLFSGLCQMAGVHCEILSGMNKSAAYEIGKKADRKSMGAQWNAVFVEDDWRFVDAFWASACVVGKKTGEWALVDAEGDLEDDDEEITEGTTQHRINEFYFLPNPDELIWTHFPDKTEWQLLKTPVALPVYQDHFYVRERFHILGMSKTPQSKIPCVLHTTDGEMDIQFGLSPANSARLRFKYMLYRSRTKSDSSIDTYLDRFVLFEHREDLLRFSLRFPVRGTFKMDIYGLDVEDSDIFDLCCSYVIECPQAKANCLPLPDCPPLGWGPVQKTKEAGLTPVSHKNAQVVARDGHVEIRLDKEKALALHQQLKHAVLDDATLSKYCLTRVEEGEVVVYLRLPQKGEYALKLFAQDAGAEGNAENVLNYLVDCQGQTDQSKPFPNTSHGLLGKGPDADRFGVKPLTHPGGTIDAKDGKVSVKFAASDKAELVCEVHTVDGKAARQVTATRRNEKGEWIFDLDLPEAGEYSLNVFAKEKGNDHEIFNVHTYLVHSEGHDKAAGDDTQNDDDTFEDNVISNETVETSDKEVFIPVPPGLENAVVEFHRRNGQTAADAEQVEVIRTEDMSMFKLNLDDYGEYMLNVYTEPAPGSGRVRNVAKYQVNRKRPGELYSGNINTIMDTIQDEDPKAAAAADTTPSAGSDDDWETVDDEEDTATEQMGELEKEEEEEEGEEERRENEPGEEEEEEDDEGKEDREIVAIEPVTAPTEEAEFVEVPLVMACRPTRPKTSKPKKPKQRFPRFANGRTYREERRLLARKAVQQAMELKDQKQLEAAIARYKDTGVPDDDATLVKAQKLLTALQAKADLMEASQKRDLPALEKALKRAKEVNFEHQLDLQIALATRLKEHLARLEKLRHAVLNMDQKTVAELKTYGKPPGGVHESMMATFLLLGSSMKEVKVWRTCQSLMAKTGRESMMRKISQFDPRAVSLKVAEQARRVTKAYTTDQVRDASAGAATFYIWAQGMIEEVESYGGAEQADQLRLQK